MRESIQGLMGHGKDLFSFRLTMIGLSHPVQAFFLALSFCRQRCLFPAKWSTKRRPCHKTQDFNLKIGIWPSSCLSVLPLMEEGEWVPLRQRERGALRFSYLNFKFRCEASTFRIAFSSKFITSFSFYFVLPSHEV